MALETISFEDLMRECNFEDPVEFRRILRRNSLPVVSSGPPVDRATANAIVKRLQGRKVNWYRYELVDRDLTEPGPLQPRAHDPSTVEEWFRRVTPEADILSLAQDRLLGAVSLGGFLQGGDEAEFALRLDPHINILIGDRGSGKSTALNLLGLLADSVSQEADDLVTKILNLLDKRSDAASTLTRRVRKVLREYGIRKCAVFFVSTQSIYCYLADLTDKTFDVLIRSESTWTSLSHNSAPVQPSMQVLQQGEVIAIADEKSRFFLHNILDGLYRDLHRCRTSLADQIKRTVTQRRYFKPEFSQLRSGAAERFLEERRRELTVLKEDRSTRHVSDRTLALLDNYVARYREIDKDSLPKTLFDMLKGGNASLYYLYLGRTRGFFESAVARLKRLGESSSGMLSDFIDTQLSSAAPPSQQMDDKEYADDISAEAEDLKQAEEIGGTRKSSIDASAAELLEDSLEWQAEDRNAAALLSTIRELIAFLNMRQRVLERWIAIYGKRRLRYTEQFAAMVNSYGELLRRRAGLIGLQESKCSQLARELNDDEFRIDLHTRDAQQTMDEHLGQVAALSGAERDHELLSQATPRTPLRDLSRSAADYDAWSLEVLNRFSELGDVESVEDELLFSPIDLSLRQGNTYREFAQLSFGQKSGIILKMVLGTTDKPIILIDQPEDNLDATSIVNMLAPTLNRLGADRQIIIATHNSHLVMGLANPHIHVLGSLGENGRLRHAGGAPVMTRELVGEMLDVLEGGFEAFNQKMQMYDQFLSRVSGSITDIDIMLIESSFRRRTIDGLRNFLQPIVSDRSLMDFLRHELKQPDYSRIQEDLIDTVHEIDAATRDPVGSGETVLLKFRRLCERLDSHILKLRSAIEEIRLLDTHPHPVPVDVHALLTALATEYISKLSRSRQIEIEISPNVRPCVFVDADHLRLVFKNLLNNSLRATEKRVVADMIERAPRIQREVVRVDARESPPFLHLFYSDNGCGMSTDIRKKLYVERCTDQKGRDHGLGGVIIRKLLDLSGGTIKVLQSGASTSPMGTIQEICLPLASDGNASVD